MKLQDLKYYGLSALSALLFLAASPPGNLYFLHWISLIPFLAVVSRLPLKKAIWHGGFFGFLTNLGIHYWLVYTLKEFGQIPPLFGVPILLLFSAASGLQFAIAGGCVSWLQLLPTKGGGSKFLQMKVAIGASSLLTTIEFLFPQLFPWYFGAAQSGNYPLMQMADITGIIGISWIVYAANFSLWYFFENLTHRLRPPYYAVGFSLISVILALAYGVSKISEYEKNAATLPTLAVGIVQPNLGNLEKLYSHYGYEGTRAIVREKFTSMTRSVRTENFHPDLIVLPETTVPGFFLHDRFVRQHLFDLANEVDSPIFFGGYHSEGEKTYNTAFLVSPNYKVLGFYNKIFLLAFGEYLPLSRFFPKIHNWFPAAGDFSRGKELTPLTLENGIRLTPMICYEVIVPRFVRRFMLKGSELIVNITNDSWFGQTNEPAQHLALTAVRAIEHRRAIVRATNTGISAVIDPLGRIHRQSPLFQPDVIRAKVPILRIYSWYSQHGDVFAIIAAILTLSLLIVTAMDRRKGKKGGRRLSGSLSDDAKLKTK